jgi:hypothetical protein
VIQNVLVVIGILTVANGLLLLGCVLVDRLRARPRAEVVQLNARCVDRPLCRVLPASRTTAASAAPRLAAVPAPTLPAQRS